MPKFYHLHVHSEFSVFASTIKIDSLLKKCSEHKMDAVAITDFGNISGAFIFYSKAKKVSIKPIIGCEIFVSPKGINDKSLKNNRIRTHLILLVKNKEGFDNLNKLISMSYSNDYDYKPRIDKDILSQHSKGLIALSACLKGEIPQLILRGETEEAEKIALVYKGIFGQDNFFLEIQNHDMLIEEQINSLLFDMGKKLSIPLAATNDCRYLLKNDYKAHDALTCHQTGDTIYNPNRFKFDSEQFYLKSSEEMFNTFSDYTEALKNTERIVSKCNLDIENHDFFMHKKNILTDDSMVERFNLHESLKAIGRVFHFNNFQIHELLERIPVDTKNPNYFLQANSKLMAWCKDNCCLDLIEIANTIEGLPHNFPFHFDSNLSSRSTCQ